MKKFNEEYMNDIALADTLSNSVNLNDIDMAIDKNVKDSKIFTEKEFKNTLEETLKDLKKNELTSKEVNLQSLDEFNDSDFQTWNQFQENAKLFKVKSSYHDSIYNPEIQNISSELKNKAEVIESELLHQKTKSSHLLEERGLLNLDDDSNEESKYSSVVRECSNKFSNKSKTSKKSLNNVCIKDSSTNSRRNSSVKKNKDDNDENFNKKLIFFLFLSLFVIFIGYRIFKITHLKEINNGNFDNEEIEDIYTYEPIDTIDAEEDF